MLNYTLLNKYIIYIKRCKGKNKRLKLSLYTHYLRYFEKIACLSWNNIVCWHLSCVNHIMTECLSLNKGVKKCI